MIRVLLVDDHPVVRAGYSRLLEQAGHVVVAGEACDAEQALSSFLRLRPDVTVADLSLPGRSGLDLLSDILAREPAARVLLFSMHRSAALAQRAFALGAAGFLSKIAAPEELIEALHVVHRGRRYVSRDLDPLDTERARLEAMRLASLTPRELEILRLLARGWTPSECGTALKLSVKTVANHQTVIKEKLAVATSASLANLALRHCLIAPEGA